MSKVKVTMPNPIKQQQMLEEQEHRCAAGWERANLLQKRSEIVTRIEELTAVVEGVNERIEHLNETLSEIDAYLEEN